MADHSENSTCLRILVANGVNLDRLGHREPEHYGLHSLADIERILNEALPLVTSVTKVKKSVNLIFFQSNDESSFLGKISESWDGLLLNPGAWTHYSYALADRLASLSFPIIEVHLSNLYKREEFRHKSVTARHCHGVVQGLGVNSYVCGLLALLSQL